MQSQPGCKSNTCCSNFIPHEAVNAAYRGRWNSLIHFLCSLGKIWGRGEEGQTQSKTPLARQVRPRRDAGRLTDRSVEVFWFPKPMLLITAKEKHPPAAGSSWGLGTVGGSHSPTCFILLKEKSTKLIPEKRLLIICWRGVDRTVSESVDSANPVLGEENFTRPWMFNRNRTNKH